MTSIKKLDEKWKVYLDEFYKKVESWWSELTKYWKVIMKNIDAFLNWYLFYQPKNKKDKSNHIKLWTALTIFLILTIRGWLKLVLV